jgi:outer membrane protein assembly factor BamE (lipoprotein component of BamABCDE complex)
MIHRFFLRKSGLIVLTFLTCSALSACVKNTESRGYTLEQADFGNVQVAHSNKQEVVNAVGSPSSKSLFGKETWYYIAAKTESVAFLTPKTKEQQVVAIEFDDTDTVSAVQRYSLADARKIEYAKEKTETAGNKASFFQQLLGNIGRFNPEGVSPRTTPRNNNY